MREKLIELVGRVQDCGCDVTDVVEMNYVENSVLVDHLIAQGVTVQEWIPVSEPPKSQQTVLVSVRDKTFGYRHTLKAAHIGHHEVTTEEYGWQEYEGETEYDEENDCFWIPECWYESNFVEDNCNWIIGSDYEVTHWMPLPEAPTTCHMTSKQPPKGE